MAVTDVRERNGSEKSDRENDHYQLVNMGEIVLAYHAPHVRQHADFAVG
ncbi:hypothetical protein [Roseofilum casamattae]|uniref:Uncharacterized protein n=1 Tax=Roseofilum casamattae BLCC-M143 TaxID=3022442 RepID=A0ABT7BUJ4_9CYAN|nr:hypothetical protein [Roseofilum casamattae]MDJ1182863.1 hypothetical protein [Roseofilum casamattae BLCC-M143]